MPNGGRGPGEVGGGSVRVMPLPPATEVVAGTGPGSSLHLQPPFLPGISLGIYLLSAEETALPSRRTK